MLTPLTTPSNVVMLASKMKSTLLVKQRRELAAGLFIESRVWQVSQPVPGSAHRYKYSLVFVAHGKCVIRYDNERGKGDHRHIGHVEMPYVFSTPDQLIADFFEDVAKWRSTCER
jgi:hypothetical protein